MQLTFYVWDLIIAAMVIGIAARIALHWWGVGMALYNIKTGQLWFDSEYVNDD